MAFALLAAAVLAIAAEVGVVGLFPGKAVVVVNGGKPLTLAVGAKSGDGVKLVAVEDGAAVLEFDGKRHSIGIGQQVFSSAGASQGGTIHLIADARGQFFTTGSLNGASVHFLVDTGATLVSLGASDAARAGIDYRSGQPATTMTANGVVRVWRVKLNAVRVGAVTLREIDAAVLEQNMPLVLLGMSFLNRMEMQREGDTMTLKKRF